MCTKLIRYHIGSKKQKQQYYFSVQGPIYFLFLFSDTEEEENSGGINPEDLEFSEHTMTHQDPVGMDFDLNSVSQVKYHHVKSSNIWSLRSEWTFETGKYTHFHYLCNSHCIDFLRYSIQQELSSEWVRQVPQMVRRRGAIMPQPIPSSSPVPSSHQDVDDDGVNISWARAKNKVCLFRWRIPFYFFNVRSTCIHEIQLILLQSSGSTPNRSISELPPLITSRTSRKTSGNSSYIIFYMLLRYFYMTFLAIIKLDAAIY